MDSAHTLASQNQCGSCVLLFLLSADRVTSKQSNNHMHEC